MTRFTFARKAILVASSVALIAGTAGAASADTRWQNHHPRREEVNNRLNRQNRRIHQERKEGELTGAQARNLHREDHQIRQEERDMASQNGSHITKSEQRTLNQQENAVSGQIGK
jgi:hypothetical protein